MIPDDDLVYLIVEVVDFLDLKPLYKKYDSLGQNSYHPAMLLGVLFYSYSKGIFSSGKIAEQLKGSVRFMYLSGMQTPDFRTISDFRKNNIDLLKEYFVEIVHICQQAGMASVNNVSIAGTKMLANASSKRSKSSDAIAEELEKVQQQINLTNPDCSNMIGFGPCYNCQSAVDNEHQIILGAKVVSENNDVHQLLPMIEEVEVNTESQGQR